jgi:hypothetical protein
MIMETKLSARVYQFLSLLVIISSLMMTAGVENGLASAGQLNLTVAVDIACREVHFDISWNEGDAPYLFYIDFGDGDTTEILELKQAGFSLTHTYPDQGVYKWSVIVIEAAAGGLDSASSGVIKLEGPQVQITSNPFPAVITAGEKDSPVTFSSHASGGTPPYTYSWDLDDDGLHDDGTGAHASFAYPAPGKYQPSLLVTDSCDFAGIDSVPVVSSAENELCHPAVQTAAQALNSLFFGQTGGTITCREIHDFLQFNHQTQPGQLGMWQAYHLAQTRDDLHWSDLQDWHLARGGWGLLVQADRFIELLGEHSLGEMADLALSERFTLGDLRSAVLAATRYEANFAGALLRSESGASPSQMAHFYQLAQELEAEPELLDAYLSEGVTLAELHQAARFAERNNAHWTEVADARRTARSWEEIHQAFEMASHQVSAAEILNMGVADYRQHLQENPPSTPGGEKDQRTADRLAAQLDLDSDEVMSLFRGECQGSWPCVRSVLQQRIGSGIDSPNDKDQKTAQQIASQYGVSSEEVLDHFFHSCSEDWACTRAYFRELAKANPDNPGQGNPSQDNPGQDNPGQDNPGQGNPGQGNPGQGNPSQDNPGQDNPGQDNPGQDNPGQGNPGQGNPGQGNPGQGNPGQGGQGQDSGQGQNPD